MFDVGGRLRLFQNFESFRVLVCGGDGSVSWVLSEIDKLDLHKQVNNSLIFTYFFSSSTISNCTSTLWLHFDFAILPFQLLRLAVELMFL